MVYTLLHHEFLFVLFYIISFHISATSASISRYHFFQLFRTSFSFSEKRFSLHISLNGFTLPPNCLPAPHTHTHTPHKHTHMHTHLKSPNLLTTVWWKLFFNTPFTFTTLYVLQNGFADACMVFLTNFLTKFLANFIKQCHNSLEARSICCFISSIISQSSVFLLHECLEWTWLTMEQKVNGGK